MRSSFVLSLLAVVSPALGAPTLIPITKRAGPVKPNSYIIKLKEGASMDTFVGAVNKIFGESSPGSSVTYTYDHAFHGLAVSLGPSGGGMSTIRGLPGIEYIEPDYIMSIFYEQGIDGLSAVSGRSDSATDSFLGKRTTSTGAGVDVYGIDTGINTQHQCFGGRARWGQSFIGGASSPNADDDNGHGTHTAGTAACEKYGGAPRANVIAIKVLSAGGSGSSSDIIKGVDHVVSQRENSGRPTVAIMSLGGLALLSQSLTDAVSKASDAGVHMVVAAGNSNVPAETSSPANAENAYTIGAVDTSKNNQKASFSNYGRLIDVWAPGVNIKSAWIGSNTAENTISGTSMAAPYVAGVLACKLGQTEQTEQSPAMLSKELKANAEKSVTFDLPGDLLAKTSSNNLFARKW